MSKKCRFAITSFERVSRNHTTMAKFKVMHADSTSARLSPSKTGMLFLLLPIPVFLPFDGKAINAKGPAHSANSGKDSVFAQNTAAVAPFLHLAGQKHAQNGTKSPASAPGGTQGLTLYACQFAISEMNLILTSLISSSL